MKQIVKNLLCLLCLCFSACSGFEDMNIDPNNPSETHPKLLLTNLCWTTFSENSNSPLYASRCLVQTDGESSEQFYKWTRGSFGYYNNLRNVTKLMEEAEKAGALGYIAIGHFFRAHYFYKLTLTFGDIPYSNALKGEADKEYYPVYDKQEDVFNGILNELKKADEILAKEKDFLSGDIIYQGDITKWRKAVNALRLKVLMSLSKVAESDSRIRTQFADIVAHNPLFTSWADNAQLVYLNQDGNRYPRFNDSGFGSGLYMASTFVSLLVKYEDPRLFSFCTQTKNAQDSGKAINDFSSYQGGDPIAPYSEVNLQAVAGNISKPNPRFYKDPTNEPQVLIGYPEQELILAEAIVRGWISGNAAVHYEAAIRASFEFYETYAKDYASYLSSTAVNTYLKGTNVAWDNALSFDQKIERIITQRYFNSYFQGMWTPFFEYLRTGYPGFPIAPTSTLPYRWMYPQDEYNNNGDNVQAAIKGQFGNVENVTNKTWWLK